MTKKELRARYKEKRRKLTVSERFNAVISIEKHLKNNFNWSSQVISLFLPIQRMNELNTLPLFERFKISNTVALPFTDLKQLKMSHRLFTDATVIANNEWDIPEPQNGAIISPEAIDIVLIPLLISDKDGYRVGYGKGFYDRFLQNCRKDALFVGLNYFPSISKISDREETDVPLHCLIHPGGIEKY